VNKGDGKQPSVGVLSPDEGQNEEIRGGSRGKKPLSLGGIDGGSRKRG